MKPPMNLGAFLFLKFLYKLAAFSWDSFSFELCRKIKLNFCSTFD